MKKYITILAAATALILAGCNKNEMASDTLGGKSVTLTLNATRGDDATKTSMTYIDEYGSLESVWKAGDKVYVYSRKSGNQIGVLNIVDESIVNQKTSATAQYATSYASFTGEVTITGQDTINDEMMFVYQGEGRSLSVTDGVLTYEIGTSADIAGLAKWDIATATGKIIGTAANASCAVNFSNQVGFGYFTTEGFTEGLDVNYYSGFTFDVKASALIGVSGTVTLPSNAEFYMPLVAGNVSMSSAEKLWSTQEGKLGYSGGIKQSKGFTAAAGSYYRLGRNAATPYGPVAFEAAEWTCYETLKNSTFNVGTELAPKMVRFTQGNLQYIGSAKNGEVAAPYWRVAFSQYACLGKGNYAPTVTDSGTRMPLDADTDLFGWGEVEPPFCCSSEIGDYNPSLDAKSNLTTDWATKFNKELDPAKLYIEQGKEYELLAEGEKYICLTKDEWQNLFANQWHCAATVTLKDGTQVKGMVICPSTFNENEAKEVIGTNAAKGKARAIDPTALFSENFLNQENIDDNGLLFLLAAGQRTGTAITVVNSYANYWSTTSGSSDKAYQLYFMNTKYSTATSRTRSYGFAVRLATYAEPTPTE